MDQERLSQHVDLAPLRTWMHGNGIIWLFDISKWDYATRCWSGWNMELLPYHLAPFSTIFLNALHGRAPRSLVDKDVRGWGDSQYTVCKGFKLLQENRSSFPCSKLWKTEWHPDGMTKINSFILLLAHCKVLTAENLRKKGILGPSWCALFRQHKESIQHLFVHCSDAKMTWSLALGDLFFLVNWPSDVKYFFTSWEKNYRGSFQHKPGFKRLWMVFPKYLCWTIWLARNVSICQEEAIPPRQSSIKAISSCVKYMHLRSLKQDPSLENYEIFWMNLLSHATTPLLSLGKEISTPNWAIMKSKAKFSEWLKQLGAYSLLFDGASRNNPRVVGAGGNLLDHRTNVVTHYVWGLGASSNNTVKGYALLKGLSIAKDRNITKIVVFGDSMLVV